MRTAMLKKIWFGSLMSFALSTCVLAAKPRPQRWTEKAANEWYAKQPWLVGSNYAPAYAINELEMWQADTFDPKRIELELGWAESIGLNNIPVFLHYLLLQQNPQNFKKRIETFLPVSDKHHINPLFFFFHSCF